MDIKTKVRDTIRKYKLATNSEKIVVALSGGKDSATTAYLLHNLGYKIKGFHINLGLGDYSNECEKAVKKLCRKLNIKLYLYNLKEKYGHSMCFLRSSIQSRKNLKNCAVCGVIKKHILNKEARKLKADKIATGHNLDDEAQTFFLNVLKGAPELSSNSGPITRNIKDKKFIPRIKPLFFVPENEIKRFSKKEKLSVFYKPCPCAKNSYRIQIRKIFKKFSYKEKENIMQNFLKLQESFTKKTTEINYCVLCNEPARKLICKRCELIKFKE